MSRKYKIKEKLFNVLPIILLSSILRFESFHESMDSLLTSFISLIGVIMLSDIVSF